MLSTEKLEVSDIVQLSPDIDNYAFASYLLVVTEIKSFGVQGYVQGLGDREAPGGQAYIRVEWKDMERTGGRAFWMTR